MNKKVLIGAFVALLVLGTAGSSFALLCASDPVPAGTLLFPFVTGKYSPTSSAANPVADRDAATTLFAITNVSSTPRIVHNVLWNDMSFPVLDWDVLLTGYDVITYNFADIMEGKLIGTGNGHSQTFSPTGTVPLAQGPVPTFFAGIPSLPPPGGTGGGVTAGLPTAIYGWCIYQGTVNGIIVNRDGPTDTVLQDATVFGPIPEFNRRIIFNGLRKSQTISENGWWGNLPPLFDTPSWLLNRSTGDNIWAYITSDVATECHKSFPSTPGYFDTQAPPVTADWYASLPDTDFIVAMGNTLMGDWFIIDRGNNSAQGNPAVHVEMDNQDIINSFEYPKAVLPGAGRSFYRYFGIECNHEFQPHQDPFNDFRIVNCWDFFTGSTGSQDYTTMADYFFGAQYGGLQPNEVNDSRESLPSAFAFRWMLGGLFDGGTKIRVWKEFPDTYPYYGFTYIYSSVQYAYYAWDEEEHVVAVVEEDDCRVSPCPEAQIEGEGNLLPLEVQEISMEEFQLPTDAMSFGWALFAFFGSNTLLWQVPGGYTDTVDNWNVFGTQAWIEVVYSASNKFSVDFNAIVMGNFLCDELAVQPDPFGSFWGATDVGDILY